MAGSLECSRYGCVAQPQDVLHVCGGCASETATLPLARPNCLVPGGATDLPRPRRKQTLLRDVLQQGRFASTLAADDDYRRQGVQLTVESSANGCMHRLKHLPDLAAGQLVQQRPGLDWLFRSHVVATRFGKRMSCTLCGPAGSAFRYTSQAGL